MRTAAERKERRLAIVEEKRVRVAQTLKVNPVVKISLTDGGDEHLLEFNNRAAIGILEDCGVNILKDRVTEAAFNPKHLTCVLYHGLKKHWPDVTLDYLDETVNIHHFAYIYERLASALEVILPDVVDLQEEEASIAKEEADEKKAPLPIADAG